MMRRNSSRSAARFVERRLVAGAHKTAVAAKCRQFVGERARKFGSDCAVGPLQGRHRLREVARHGGEFSKPRGKIRRRENPVADRSEIARPAAADHDPRQRACKIGHGLEAAAQIVARGRIVDEGRNRIEPMRDLRRIGQRRGETLRQQPRSGRRNCSIDRREERTAPFAGKRAYEFEIASRRLIDGKRCAGCFPHRRGERRMFADLRALDIGDGGGRSGKLDARKRAERRRRRHAEERCKSSLRGRSIKHVARERRHRRQAAQHWD